MTVPRIEEVYQKKTQLEHILLRPDTYVGSVELEEKKDMWIVDQESKKMTRRTLQIVPGLYKIFDEILVNAADNKQRDTVNMTRIQVDIDRDAGCISVWNNGKGVPVQMHQEHKVFVPSLIFGELLTSSNYDDDERKVVGGRNGFGAKLTNIFSNEFTIETADSESGQHFVQRFSQNMSVSDEPIITKMKKSHKDFTKVSFKPDFKKFGMENGLDDDIVDLMIKRVYDMAGCTDPSVTVYLDGKLLPVRRFKQYVDMYLPEGEHVYEQVHDRWTVCIAPSDGHFEQVSFVNSIWTIKGGTHVSHVVDQVSKHIVTQLSKGSKGIKLKPSHVKNHLFVCVNALIENPAFDSQTKESLTLRAAKFGSKCELNASFLKKVMKIGIVEQVTSWAKFKENKDLKKNDGKKRTKLSGIPKLDDANKAGGKEASKCTIILTEGDSAKALALSGLSIVGRDYYGVFPLKGKLLNVRGASHTQIMKNDEVSSIKKIVGLAQGKVYDDVKALRYGHIMIMADQDTDGSHIKGLVVNLIHFYWPSLLHVRGFLTQFITPIVKCTKSSVTETFFTIPQYHQWRERPGHDKGWTIKYYKGLGTSTSKEAKSYFSNLQRHRIDFVWNSNNNDENNDAIDMAFSTKRIEDRKEWLQQFEPGTFADYSSGRVTFKNFIHHELILFSHEDNERSIPSMVDGLKPGQRKILFSCFKRKLSGEIKVAQLAGYVSEHSAYHHGEVSLTGAIVGMAQNYVGSHNVNTLLPIGQFGTRHQLGKDSASARYIFTSLSPVTRVLFSPSDDMLLNYLKDDGISIEPDYYAPIVPLVLINGADGIGTGYSTTVPNFNPRELVEWIRLRLHNRHGEMPPLQPWYKGFKGEIFPTCDAKGYVKPGRYTMLGALNFDEVDENIVHITELPVKKSTESHKELLTSLVEAGTLLDFDALHTDTTVHFAVHLPPGKTYTPSDLFSLFKLSSSLSTTNMTLFDADGKIRRYDSAEDVLEAFFVVRLALFSTRKDWLIQLCNAQLKRLDNKMRFITDVVNDTLELRNRKKVDIVDTLDDKGYDQLTLKEQSHAEDLSGETSFDYLLNMPLLSLTLEKVQLLSKQHNEKKIELATLKNTAPEDMWRSELEQFIKAIETQENIDTKEQISVITLQKKAQKSSKTAHICVGEVIKLERKAAKPQLKIVQSDIQSIDDKTTLPSTKAALLKKSSKVDKTISSRLPSHDSVLDSVFGAKSNVEVKTKKIHEDMEDDGGSISSISEVDQNDEVCWVDPSTLSLTERLALRKKNFAKTKSNAKSQLKTVTSSKCGLENIEPKQEHSVTSSSPKSKGKAVVKTNTKKRNQKKKETSQLPQTPPQQQLEETSACTSTPAKNVSPLMKRRRMKVKGSKGSAQTTSPNSLQKQDDDPFDMKFDEQLSLSKKKSIPLIPLSPHTPVRAKNRARRAATVAIKYDRDEVSDVSEDQDSDSIESVSSFSACESDDDGSDSDFEE